MDNGLTYQPGFQEEFLSTPADIAIGGGAAGAGKSFVLLMESLRYIENPEYGGAIFRKTYPQIKAPGGLWDTSMLIYTRHFGTPLEASYEWKFPSGARIKFSHLEYEKNVLDWQGSQVAFIGFDELTHFSEYTFMYLLSRNRSTCGVRPYVRATCNPDPDSWVADFIAWWIDQETGFPIPERAGKLRYFVKDRDSYVWGDTKKEVIDKISHLVDVLHASDPDIQVEDLVKSVTFIPGDIYGNKELLKADPAYLGNLMAQDENTQAQLLHGNWKVRIDGADLIKPMKLRDAFTNDFVPGGLKCITADIALKGSDLLMAGVWDGFRLIDIEFLPIAKGNDVIDMLKVMAAKHQVPQSHIVYDDDGAGSFIDGFIKNARPFNNGRPAMRKENYNHRKSQCYFKMGARINNDGYYFTPKVLATRVGDKTFERHLIDDRRAIKQDKPDFDGKLRVMPKDQMKNIIGHSPDIYDMIMMREYFEYLPPIEPGGYNKADLGFY